MYGSLKDRLSPSLPPMRRGDEERLMVKDGKSRIKKVMEGRKDISQILERPPDKDTDKLKAKAPWSV